MPQHVLAPVKDLTVLPLLGQIVQLARSHGTRVTFLRLLSSAETPAAEGGGAGPDDGLMSICGAAARAIGVPSSGAYCYLGQQQLGQPSTARCEFERIAHLRGCNAIALPADWCLAEQPGAHVASNFSTWTLKPDTDLDAAERVLSGLRADHRVMVGAARQGLSALAGTALRPAARQAFQAAHALLLQLTDQHHSVHEAEGLFRMLRTRTGQLNAELTELERQHAQERVLLRRIERTLRQIESAAPNELDATDTPELTTESLRADFEPCVEFVWEHIGRQEGVVFPAALRHLRPEDWEELARQMVV